MGSDSSVRDLRGVRFRCTGASICLLPMTRAYRRFNRLVPIWPSPFTPAGGAPGGGSTSVLPSTRPDPNGALYLLSLGHGLVLSLGTNRGTSRFSARFIPILNNVD